MLHLTEIANKLIAASVVSAIQTDVFLSRGARIPDGDGPYLSLIDTGGSGPSYTHNRKSNPYCNISIQLVTRAKDATVAWTLCNDAIAELQGIRNTTLGTSFYLWIRPVQSDPMELPLDERRRARFAFNINARLTLGV